MTQKNLQVRNPILEQRGSCMLLGLFFIISVEKTHRLVASLQNWQRRKMSRYRRRNAAAVIFASEELLQSDIQQASLFIHFIVFLNIGLYNFALQKQVQNVLDRPAFFTFNV
jgi:hypothetical protein